MDQIIEKHKKLIQLIEEINKFTNGFNGMTFFKTPSLEVSFNSNEVCFRSYVFYLYSLFVELPGVNLKFVEEKINAQHRPVDRQAFRITRLVNFLRTIYGHHTTEEKPVDLEKRNYCDDWYKEVTGTDKLIIEEQFRACAETLLDDTLTYLQAILECINDFAHNEFQDIIKEEWDRQVNRNFSKYQWELELIEVLERYNMNHYDSLEIVEKQLSKWSDRLKLLKDGFDFKSEARKIIEDYIAKDELWPASGDDLIVLGVEKGPALKNAIAKAKAMYYADPCPRQEFLERLAKVFP